MNAVSDWKEMVSFTKKNFGIFGKVSYGFKDKDGKVIIKPQYDWADEFRDGVARIIIKEKYGYIDAEGSMILPPIFDWADNFYKGKASVHIENRVFFINTAGHCISTHFLKINEPISDDFLARYNIKREV
jgi:hypothetical protein